MSTLRSPEATGFTNDVRQTIDYINIPLDNAVLLASGAMYLGAAAVGEACRPPRDIDLSVAPEYLGVVRDRLPNARVIPTPEGYYYNGQVGNWSIDIGSPYGSLSHDRLRSGVQYTPEGVAFASLNHVAQYKEHRDLPKDREDRVFISHLFEQFRPTIGGLACTAEAAFGNTDASWEAQRFMANTIEAPISENEARVVEAVGMEGLRRMGVRYGTGAPNFQFIELGPYDDPRENKKILWYNTQRHAGEVAEDAYTLAKAMGLGELACHALWLAGGWHDIDQSSVIRNPANRDGSDELSSAQELIEVLRESGVSKEVAFWAAYFIQGTQVKTKGSTVVGQLVGLLDASNFPSREAELAARIGASADLARLYDDLTVAYGLLPQRLGIDYPNVPDLRDPATRSELYDFTKIQQHGFLSNHRYSLQKAEELFAGNRVKRVEQIELLVDIFDKGGMPETWHEFIDLVRRTTR